MHLFRFISFDVFVFRFNIHSLMEDARLFSTFLQGEDHEQAGQLNVEG